MGAGRKARIKEVEKQHRFCEAKGKSWQGLGLRKYCITIEHGSGASERGWQV